MRVTLKSAYLPYDLRDGARYLVETLWPEGVDTHGLLPYLWVRELAPSYDMKETALWAHWTPEKFREEYRKELQTAQRASWFALLVTEAREKGVTLLHHSHKKESRILPEDTSAYYLKEFLEAELNKWPELSQSQSLSATAVVPQGGSNQGAGQWTNEGGR